ncbi:hypothetical protein Acor_02910 [Acrocarpospora corrugata]|uniref:Uncharacterized protein n=2 Tax=Acrocarpospora corrugata TaxID=35763 RepID=A0A5M3VQC6_9ACTN|nr:hypothetical protein Acor_02910 [Acrocarpospora corrugata]
MLETSAAVVAALATLVAGGNALLKELVGDDPRAATAATATEPDDRPNGRLPPMDLPLGVHAESNTVCLRVSAAGHAGQDPTFWANPHIRP